MLFQLRWLRLLFGLMNKGMKCAEKVLLAISMECSRQRKLAEINCFDKIADKAQVPRQKLDIYLSELEEKGYIKYSLSERFIYITREGRKYIS